MREIHIIDNNRVTLCGARTPEEWYLSAYTLKAAETLAIEDGRQACQFCAKRFREEGSCGA